VATPKKSWRNTLTVDESATTDQMFEKVLDLKNAGGRTICGTEGVSVFLKLRVQPLMSRPYQLWMYVGKDDESRVSPVDLSDEELRDEVRCLTRFSQKDNIVLTLARPPFDLKHLPAKVIFFALVPNVVFVSLFELLTASFSVDRLPPSLSATLLHPKVG
jgi:hypothetical protein